MRMRAMAVLAAALLVGCTSVDGGGGRTMPVGVPSEASLRLDLPPRLQWYANYGYCGETSMIAAGLYYGQYTSQYDARALASPGVPQSSARSQLLLGVNDLRAAAAMHLAAIEWPTYRNGSTDDFLVWIERNVVLRRPVIVGVYMNESVFSSSSDESQQYDHIVIVVGARSHHELGSGRYYADDALTFSDNGLYDVHPLPRPGHWKPLPPFFFSDEFGRFQRTRAQANQPRAPIYSLPIDGRGQHPGNFGVAISGVVDRDRETLPVRVAASKMWEYPYMRDGSNARPKPEPLTLTVTVSRLKPGVSYHLYRYDAFSSVPNERFNVHAAAASQRWSIRISSGSTYVLRQHVMSDQTVVYRAVPASSP
jgi:hypothetical protein